jgi:hypothetical protein
MNNTIAHFFMIKALFFISRKKNRRKENKYRKSTRVYFRKKRHLDYGEIVLIYLMKAPSHNIAHDFSITPVEKSQNNDYY